MGDLLRFNGVSRLDIPPERVLTDALEKDLELAVVIGVDKDGQFYFASSASDGGEILWWLNRAVWKLNKVTDELEGET
jgi:hypothetical protein